MNRQLYMGGGITQLPMNEIMVPRGEYGLGSIVKSVGKAVKGVAKGIGDIAKSDIGKAALLYAGTAGLSSLGAGGKFGSLFKLGTYAPSTVMGNIGALFAPGAVQAGTGDVAGRGIFRKAFDKLGTAGLATTALGGLTGYLASQGMSNEEIEEIQRDPATLSTYLRQYYTNLNPELINQPEAVDRFVKSQLAEYGYAIGGRVGLSDGGNDDLEYKGWKKIFLKSNDAAESHPRHSEFIKRFAEETMGQDRSPEVRIKKAIGGDLSEPISSFEQNTMMAGPDWYVKRVEILMELGYDYETASEIAFDSNLYDDAVGGMNKGGRPGYALGDTATMAAQVEGLPLRNNQAGITELDLRDSGGFIPPVGIKEKADDIPAMLSNNEFVFTADAVRGMGDGDVDVGAQRMYNIMKKLEKGGRV